MIDARTLDKFKLAIVAKVNELFPDGGKQAETGAQLKSDGSIVTKLDFFVSDLIKEELIKKQKLNFNFFSEEDFDLLKYPVVLLDPIDGTKELVQQIPECSVSLALFNDQSLNNYGWIYNPFTGFEIDTKSSFKKAPHRKTKGLLGLVSTSEWKDGLYSQVMANQVHKFSESGFDIILQPVGSIAYKLGLLAAGACDFVITLYPKNIWDIAAGSAICHVRGLKMFSKHGEVKFLEKTRYEPPLCWCYEENFELIRSQFLESFR